MNERNDIVEKHFEIRAGDLILSRLRRGDYLISSDTGGAAIVVRKWEDIVDFATQVIAENFNRNADTENVRYKVNKRLKRDN